MEAGYGSAIPSCVIAHLSKTGAAMRSGLLNVGDHIITINGVNLVGMHKKTCIEQLKVRIFCPIFVEPKVLSNLFVVLLIHVLGMVGAGTSFSALSTTISTHTLNSTNKA